MTGKEIVTRIIKHNHPPRIGFDFLGNNPSDILHVSAAVITRPGVPSLWQWGRDPSLTKQVPNFSGEVMMTPMGDIFGRFDQKTKGECIRGALQDGWETLEKHQFPVIDEVKDREFESMNWAASDKFVLGGMPFAVWSPLRDARHIDQALMDTLLEPELVQHFLDALTDLAVTIIQRAYKNGINGVMIWDDLGTQKDLFFSPETFKTLFKPYYKKLADALHNCGMLFFMHSCGMVYKDVPDLIDAGVDVFQFDQPELKGSAVWSQEFGGKAAFYCPVDIQKIMASGDEKTIKNGALEMVNAFKKCGGSLIAKDYPSWDDLNIPPEWQQWARDTIIAHAEM